MANKANKEEKILETPEIVEPVAPIVIDTAPIIPVQEDLGDDDIIVKDPQVLRPVQLPLVITPKDGKWKSKAQEEFAKVLNGYAYKNPAKFKLKQAKLLAELRAKEFEPDPMESNLKFKNNLA